MTPRKQGYTVTGVPYAVYIRSAVWTEVKRRYRASKLPQNCVVCGNHHVDLHHKTYKRLGAEWLTDLVPLCRIHHKRVHRKAKNGSASIWTGPRHVRREVARKKKRKRDR